MKYLILAALIIIAGVGCKKTDSGCRTCQISKQYALPSGVIKSISQRDTIICDKEFTTFRAKKGDTDIITLCYH